MTETQGRTWEVGERVYHRGAKLNGTVAEIRPMADGSYELRIDPEEDRELPCDAWWASYHTEKGTWTW